MLKGEIECESCGEAVKLTKETLIFRKYRVALKNKKRLKTRCDFYKSAKTDTFFHNMHMSIETVCIGIHELNVSNNTVVGFQLYCREICIAWVDETSSPIGGNGVTVEIDETIFGH